MRKKIFECEDTGERITIEKDFDNRDFSYDEIHNWSVEDVERVIMYVNENTFRDAMRNIAKSKDTRKKIISIASTVHGRMYDIIKEMSY